MSEIFNSLEKYNYWHGEKINAGYRRTMYLERVQKYLGNNLIKIFAGQRRVGKSYILRQIIQYLLENGVNPINIFYLNKEIIDFDSINNWKSLDDLINLYKKTLRVQGKIYLFLDEIQEIDGWEKIVNSLAQNYVMDYEVFLTGSNSHLLSFELSTLLSGRYISFEVLPFLFEEYCDFLQLEKNKTAMLRYLKEGAMPQLFTLPDEETKQNYISSLRDTIMLKDIVERHKIKDAYLLERIFKFLSDNIGNLFSINALVNYLNTHKIKTNFETVSNYVEYLRQTFLLHAVDRYDIKGKAILSGNKKYYLNDLSFKNYLSSRFDGGLGKNLENYVYLYFKSRGYKIYVGVMQNTEVDFIVEKKDLKKYIQVAYLLADDQVIEREFRSLEKIRDSYEKIVITLDDVPLGNRNGIQHQCAWALNESMA